MPRRDVTSTAPKPEASSKDAEAEPAGASPDRGSSELAGITASQARVYLKSIAIIGLLAVYSHASQLTLAPVFGGIPASLWHNSLLLVTCMAAWIAYADVERYLPGRPGDLLPVIAIYIPAVQFFLSGFSGLLGPQWGPVAIEALTLVPLAVISSTYAARHLESAHLGFVPPAVAREVPSIASWCLWKGFEILTGRYLPRAMGRTFLLTRLGLEMMLAGCYTVLAPSKLLVFSLPGLFHLAFLNTHVATPLATVSLNNSMQLEGWRLLERRESITGYLSTIENVQQGFRVLRCDHSVLGGNWIRYQGKKILEPVYGIFTMLEAVRLVQIEHPVADKDAKALVIGLGVGTTPSALVAHGINTTVVEIDPVVYEFATKYFEYHENNPPVIGDAVGYTSKLARESKETFDYIVHDVFTGGAEPVDLFTLEFLENLRDLLKPEGVIAINYAGDFSLPAPEVIFRTIHHVFPSCRTFRESPANETAVEAGEADFTNTVVFCKKAKKPMVFRRPVMKDFLGSGAREIYLEPKHEVLNAQSSPDENAALLRQGHTRDVVKWHKKSAVGHWRVMRTVVPAKIWEMW